MCIWSKPPVETREVQKSDAITAYKVLRLGTGANGRTVLRSPFHLTTWSPFTHKLGTYLGEYELPACFAGELREHTWSDQRRRGGIPGIYAYRTRSVAAREASFYNLVARVELWGLVHRHAYEPRSSGWYNGLVNAGYRAEYARVVALHLPQSRNGRAERIAARWPHVEVTTREWNSETSEHVAEVVR